VQGEVEVYEIRPVGQNLRNFNNPLIFDEAAKALVGELDDKSASASHAHSQTYIPLNEHTRPIRDSIREAFKAFRGNERVQVLEKLRSVWRVELPSGGTFKGLSESQLEEKKRRRSKSEHRKGSVSAGKPHLSKDDVHPPPRGAHMNSIGQLPSIYSSEISMAYSTNDEDEDDEDVLFRVVAQRVAPAMKQTTSDRGNSRPSVPENIKSRNQSYGPVLQPEHLPRSRRSTPPVTSGSYLVDFDLSNQADMANSENSRFHSRSVLLTDSIATVNAFD
jgi:hypothetical protein